MEKFEMAVELAGLSEKCINELISATNKAAIRNSDKITVGSEQLVAS